MHLCLSESLSQRPPHPYQEQGVTIFLKDFFKVFIEFVTLLLLFYVLVFCPQDVGLAP